MKVNSNRIYIIGSGLSGLTAANYLENKGYEPTIIEATNKVGGRVKTDIINNYQLDHGFQVLLTAYPLAKKYLNLEKLELQNITPGAIVFNKNKKNIIGDPLRDLSLFWKTIFSDIASLKDKLLILKLSISLKKQTLEKIFSKPQITTYKYLNKYGFSDNIIANFFKPFFSGIFLEDKLDTSSIMFEYIFKMFAEGYASIPKGGMQAIPNQLKDNLIKTKFIFNTKVKSIKGKTINLDTGETLESDFIINTTEYDFLNIKKETNLKWRSCETLYFETNDKILSKAIIGLISDENSLINNIFYHTSVGTETKGAKELISVTVVKKHNFNNEELIQQIIKELKIFCKINSATFIKKYNIRKALPNISKLSYSLDNKLNKCDNIINAGDVNLNPSLNAAMISGEHAAKMIIKNIN